MSQPTQMSNEQIAKTCWINMVEEEDQDGIQKVTLQPIIAALDAKDTLLYKLTAENERLRKGAPCCSYCLEAPDLKAERDAAQNEVAEANEKLARLSHIIWLHHEVGFIQKMAKTIGGCYICMENKTFNDAPNQHKLSHKEEVEELRKESDEFHAQWIKSESDLKIALECLKSYEQADYKGEWNDVDGGWKARFTLAKINGASEETLKQMEEDRKNSW